MSQIIILQGVPGSGKSTYADKLISFAKDKQQSAKIVSADNYFINLETGEYKFNPNNLGQAHATCFRNFIESILAKTNLIIVDNTNTTLSEISPYMLAANAYDYQSEIHQINIDPYLAASRNIHGVDIKKVLEMASRIEKCNFPNYWKVLKINTELG